MANPSSPCCLSHSKRNDKFLRLTVGIATAALMLLWTAGCGNGGGEPQPLPSPSPTATPVPTPSLSMSADERADYLLGYMTQEEKLNMIHGYNTSSEVIFAAAHGAGGYVPAIPRLQIPALYLADGSVGVGNRAGEATALPSSMASAATWDLDQAYRYGEVIGKEMRALGMNVNLGGNVNLAGREPRNGRNFETKGEDPILAGRINAQHLRAIQDQHVVAGIKHYVLNDQETGRQYANVVIDERAARETDLLAFEIGVKDANVQSVMCSYNLFGGSWLCENNHLLNEVLKGDWGFQGWVMSDWWAAHSSYTAAINGLDQEQPGPDHFGAIGGDVAAGRLPQSRLDDMVHRILRGILAAGAFDNPVTPGGVDAVAGASVAQETEEQGAVLLKNTGILPLDAGAGHSIAVIGSHANLGVLSGGGSAQVYPVGGVILNEGRPNPPGWSPVFWDPSSPLAAIEQKASDATVRFDEGTNATNAATLAASSQVAIVFVSQWASEGMDVPSLNLTDVIHVANPTNQDALVAAVAAANPHTIVVIESGGPIAMPWIQNVAAVLEAWYPGQRGGQAIANLLFGSVNPSGKLPVTFPVRDADLPHPVIAGVNGGSTVFDVHYDEGLQVGYKWFDQQNIEPLFPFGYGLSYTTFTVTPQGIGRPAADQVSVTARAANIGTRAGAEVVQVYLEMPASLNEPPRRLVGWEKVPLEAGAQQDVTITIDGNSSAHPFSYWDTNTEEWRLGDGEYTLYVGNSSRSLAEAGRFHISGGVISVSE